MFALKSNFWMFVERGDKKLVFQSISCVGRFSFVVSEIANQNSFCFVFPKTFLLVKIRYFLLIKQRLADKTCSFKWFLVGFVTWWNSFSNNSQLQSKETVDMFSLKNHEHSKTNWRTQNFLINLGLHVWISKTWVYHA